MIIGTFYSVFRSYVTSLKINLMQSRCRVLVKLHSPGGWWTHLSRTTGILTLSALCVRGCISVTSWNHFQSAGMSILVVLTIFLPLSLVLSVCSLFFYVISGENHGKFWNLICMFEYLDYDFLFFNSKIVQILCSVQTQFTRLSLILPVVVRQYLSQVQVLFHICKYKFKYSKYLEASSTSSTFSLKYKTKYSGNKQ